MRKVLKQIALAGWIFIAVGQDKTMAPSIVMVIGPFKNPADCEEMRTWLTPSVKSASPCKEDGRTCDSPAQSEPAGVASRR